MISLILDAGILNSGPFPPAAAKLISRMMMPCLPETQEHLSDLDLVQRAIARIPDAVDTLSQRLLCVPPMIAAHNQHFGSHFRDEEIDDLAHDTILLVLRKLSSFTGTSRLETWIYAYCRGEFLNALRRRQRRSKLDGELPTSLLDPRSEEPSVRLSRLDEADGLARALASLRDSEAEMIRMKHYAGLTFTQIAKRLSISINTAKTNYYRAFEVLRRRLYGRGQEQGHE